MKKNNKYLRLLPFAISIICLTIYLVYVIHLKLHPSIIVTSSMITTLKVILIIALVSLFIGLLLILIRKIYSLQDNERLVITKKEEVITTRPETIVKEEVVTIKPETIAKEETTNVIINDRIVDTKEEVVREVKEEKIMVKEEIEKDNRQICVSCPECGGLISEKAAICPHCGILFDKEVIKVLKKYDRQKADEKRSYGVVSALINLFIIIIFVIFIIIIINVLVDKYNKNYKNFNILKTEEKQ